ADYLRDQLRLTAAVANELEIMDGKFTGHVIGDIVDAEYKANTSATDNSAEGNREREQFRAQFIRSQTGFGVQQGRAH
ncbi:hypothetical protein MJM83_29125, partial [Salmonella enterica subsp. enterica serovar Montevideo]|nr:hypothetical protein [Salmonella enterica subsp. enterica serovar Montevideo]